jgi:putative acetyltransferase
MVSMAGSLVREERPEDRDAVRRVHDAAFGQPGEGRLVDALRDAGLVEVALVADDGGAVVGHIVLSRAALDTGAPVLALGPVGVLPERQREGIGVALNRAALQAAQDLPYALVVVLGHAAYYPRFGFERASALGIRAPFEVPDEAWMAMPLPAHTADARGTVVYPPPWAEV